jgi:hypothetical protein
MLIGYARTSTVDQDYGLDAQIEALTAAGCDPEFIYREKVSSVANRPKLDEVLIERALPTCSARARCMWTRYSKAQSRPPLNRAAFVLSGWLSGFSFGLPRRELAKIAPVVVQEIEGPHAETAIVSIETAGQLSNGLWTHSARRESFSK